MILTDVWTPNPTGIAARSLVESTARLNVWDGSVRSGKTIDSILRWIEYVARPSTSEYGSPEGELLMVGKTERTLKRNVLDVIGEMVGSDFRFLAGTGEARLFGRRIYVAGANDERAEAKIRGLTLAGFYGDEITTWPEGFFKQVTVRNSVKGSKGFVTTNPDSPLHWFKKDYLDRTEVLNLRRFHFTLDDNPTLDPAYVADLKREFTGLWYRRFILGEWVQAEGAIYDCWDQDRFVIKGRFPRIEENPYGPNGQLLPGFSGPHMSSTWLGVDYGTVNPFSALLFGLGEDSKVYVMAELYWDSRKENHQKTDAQYSADVMEFLRFHNVSPEWTYVDPSAASFVQQLWRDGLPGVRPADNKVVDGIRTVSTALAQDRIRVHESCKSLINEIGGYVWDAKAQKRGLDQPLKSEDHSVDAMRYGLASTKFFWSRLHIVNDMEVAS